MMLKKILLKKGHEFHGPDGQGYRLTKDAREGDEMSTEYFEAFGGAPEPEPLQPWPEWLSWEIEAAVRAGR